MDSVINTEQIIRLIAAFLFVLALMGGLHILLRVLNKSYPNKLNKDKRLKIIEMLPLDSKRKMLIIQRDQVQHLIILGTSSETIIETGIETDKIHVDSEGHDVE